MLPPIENGRQIRAGHVSRIDRACGMSDLVVFSEVLLFLVQATTAPNVDEVGNENCRERILCEKGWAKNRIIAAYSIEMHTVKLVEFMESYHLQDSILMKLYELYSDYALKNPFYTIDMPIR